jgi:hypothetical protein
MTERRTFLASLLAYLGLPRPAVASPERDPSRDVIFRATWTKLAGGRRALELSATVGKVVVTERIPIEVKGRLPDLSTFVVSEKGITVWDDGSPIGRMRSFDGQAGDPN